jgi:molecular chaperone IbpA
MFEFDFTKGEQLVNDIWNILDHPTFPFVTLTSTTNGARNFPAYNIVERKDGTVRLEMAVAGFTKERITVAKEGNTLIIQGKSYEMDPDESLRHKGISNSAFLRTFDLTVDALIESVELRDGILSVVITTTPPKQVLRTTFDIK